MIWKTKTVLLLVLLVPIEICYTASSTPGPTTTASYTEDEISEKIEFWKRAQTQKHIDEFMDDFADLLANGKVEDTSQTCLNTPYSDEAPVSVDYIVVGGSQSGPVMASRLSELPDKEIFFLNPVEPLEEKEKIPYFFTFSQYMKLSTRRVYAEPKDNFGDGLQNKKTVVGYQNQYGAIFSPLDIITNHGTPSNVGWATNFAFGDLMPYYLKVEAAKNLSNINPAFHCTTGTVGNAYGYNPDIWKKFINASMELGYKNIDYTSCEVCGVSRAQTQLRDGKYDDIDQIYLKDALPRENMRMEYGRPIKVLTNSKKEAVGIQYIKGSKIYTVNARKEVILAMGALNTPRLLMLSGMGPKQQSQSLGIPLVLDNSNIGSNMRDCLGSFGFPVKGSPADLLNSKQPFGDASQREYVNFHTGPLTSIASIEALARTKGVNGDCSRLWTKLCAYYFNRDAGDSIYEIFNINGTTMNKFLNTMDDPNSYFCIVPAINPKSGGTIRLRSADPCADPLINMDYLQDPDDLTNLLKAVNFTYDLMQTATFKNAGIKLHDAPLPGCEDKWNLTDKTAYKTCAIRKYIISTQDPTGGCSYGTVLDDQLKVKNIKNLRVCDPSIVPDGFTGPTRTFSAMLGEKCSDMIKEELGITYNCGS